MAQDQKIKVLCVEDEQDIRENIVEILRDEGFEVLEAGNGKEALDIFLDKEPDIIVSDVMMPEVSGYDLLKIIRENKTIRNNNVPFIFLTALGQKENVMKGINLSANDYLIKPIDFDLLIAKIKEKAGNAIKVQELHTKSINNIKTQVSHMIPVELSQYIGVINQIAGILKTEPYGPFPHKRYLDDLNMIYMTSVKLKTVVDNIANGVAISNHLDSNDEIVNPVALTEEFIGNLSEKFRSKIKLDISNESSLSNIKIDKTLLIEAIRKILAGLFKTNINNEVEISIITDHMEQLIFIFHLIGSAEESVLRNNIDKDALNKFLAKQGCSFEIVSKGNDISIPLYIPAYRVIKKSINAQPL